MLIDDFAEKASAVIYTTSDDGAKYLYDYLKRIGQEGWTDNIFHEYLSLKFAIAVEEIYKAVNSQASYNDVYAALSRVLKGKMDRMPSSMNYNHTFASLQNAMKEYAFKSDVEKAFLFQVKSIIIPLSASNELVNRTRISVNGAFARIASGKSAYGSSGCGCAVASLGLLLVAALSCLLF